MDGATDVCVGVGWGGVGAYGAPCGGLDELALLQCPEAPVSKHFGVALRKEYV